MSTIRYFRATEGDIPTLVECRILFQTEYWGGQTAVVVAELATSLNDYFKKSIPEGTCIAWLAADGDAIVGIGMMAIREQPGNFRNPSGKQGYVLNMYTHPDYRRRGICSTILRNLIASAEEQGVVSFELHATKEGAPVYERNGFILHNEPTYRIYSGDVL